MFVWVDGIKWKNKNSKQKRIAHSAPAQSVIFDKYTRKVLPGKTTFFTPYQPSSNDNNLKNDISRLTQTYINNKFEIGHKVGEVIDY